jgi:hypothetical protein
MTYYFVCCICGVETTPEPVQDYSNEPTPTGWTEEEGDETEFHDHHFCMFCSLGVRRKLKCSPSYRRSPRLLLDKPYVGG